MNNIFFCMANLHITEDTMIDYVLTMYLKNATSLTLQSSFLLGILHIIYPTINKINPQLFLPHNSHY